VNPFSLFPVEASSEARSTDLIFFGLIGFSLVVILAVLGFVVSFAIRYRRNSAAARGALPQWLEHGIEIGWTLAATFLFVLAALWTAATRLAVLAPPSDAMEIHVVAKQWMWKAQHANGVREINALHVPLGAAVRLSMTSEDVIHSFSRRSYASNRTCCRGDRRGSGSRRCERANFTCFARNYAEPHMRA